LSASLLPLLATGSIGIIGLLLVAIPAQWSGILVAVVLQGLVLLLALYMNLFQDLLNARERFGVTSALTAARVSVTASVTTLLLSLTSLGVEAAVAASLSGVAVAVAGEVVVLKRMGLSFRPAWHRSYLVAALKLGVFIQASYLLMAMSQHVDQLLVYSIIGPAEGGRYAVALTLGLLPGFVPVAISQASFPRLADISDDQVWPLTAQVVRVGLIGGAVAAACLVVGVPLLAPVVFGPTYARSVTPALILMIGGLMWSVQWILARAWAARGRPGLLLASFICTTAVMLLLDLIFIKVWGMEGAAVASVLGSAAGLAVCLNAYRRGETGFRARHLLPRPRDARFLIAHARELLSAT